MRHWYIFVATVPGQGQVCKNMQRSGKILRRYRRKYIVLCVQACSWSLSTLYPHWALCSILWSASTAAIIASATGTARMPTQGSWRPLVITSTASPSLLIDFFGVRIELVGLMANRATIGCPVVMPPRIPPALLLRNSGIPFWPGPHFVCIFFTGQTCSLHPCANLNSLGGIDGHQGRGKVCIHFAVNGRTPTSRDALGHYLNYSADGAACLANGVKVCRPYLGCFRVGAEKGISIHFIPVKNGYSRSYGYPSVPLRP